MRKFEYYDDWKETTFTCETCGWTGKLDGKKQDDPDMEILDWTGAWYSCPRCRKGIAWVVFPTYGQLQERAKTGDPEAVKEWRKLQPVIRREEAYERDKLKSPSQLPEIDGEALGFEWDIVDEKDGEGYNVLRVQGREIWRELAWYENLARFYEVKAIIKVRYGPRFRSLTPAEGSSIWLYGDKSFMNEIDVS